MNAHAQPIVSKNFFYTLNPVNILFTSVSSLSSGLSDKLLSAEWALWTCCLHHVGCEDVPRWYMQLSESASLGRVSIFGHHTMGEITSTLQEKAMKMDFLAKKLQDDY